MPKQIITTPNAPAPIGPYNQAILINGTLYTSGQIPIDPKTGVLVQDSIEKETKQVMENMKAVLEAAKGESPAANAPRARRMDALLGKRCWIC